MVKTPAFHAGIVGSNPARVTFGGLAQLGEHLPYKQEVTGSSPVSSIFYYFDSKISEVKLNSFQIFFIVSLKFSIFFEIIIL